MEWCTANGISGNPSKFQIRFLGLVTPSEHVKLLGVTIDNALKFDTHVHVICNKANQKLHAFGRLRPGADPEIILTRAQPKARGCGYMGVALSMGPYKHDLVDAAQLSA